MNVSFEVDVNRKAPKKCALTAFEVHYRKQVIAHFIMEAQALVLDRIVMPTIDRRFDSLCHELAGLLGCHVSEALKILSPAVRELYRATRDAASHWRVSHGE